MVWPLTLMAATPVGASTTAFFLFCSKKFKQRRLAAAGFAGNKNIFAGIFQQIQSLFKILFISICPGIKN